MKDQDHIRGAPQRPIGKIGRKHRSMKNSIKLRNYKSPLVLEQSVGKSAEYHSQRWYHEARDNLTPEGVNYLREQNIKLIGERIKEATLQHHRKWNLGPDYAWTVSLNLRGGILPYCWLTYIPNILRMYNKLDEIVDLYSPIYRARSTV